MPSWRGVGLLLIRSWGFRKRSHVRNFLKGVNYMGTIYIQKESGGEKISVPAGAEIKIETYPLMKGVNNYAERNSKEDRKVYARIYFTDGCHSFSNKY